MDRKRVDRLIQGLLWLSPALAVVTLSSAVFMDHPDLTHAIAHVRSTLWCALIAFCLFTRRETF